MTIRENLTLTHKTYISLPKSYWDKFSTADVDSLLEKLFESEKFLKANITKQNCNDYIEHVQIVAKILKEKVHMLSLADHVQSYGVVVGTTCLKILR